VVLPCALACAGFVLAAGANGTVAIVGALVLANVGISAAKAPLWAMPSAFLSGAGAAAGIAMINSLGNLGGFVGPSVIGWLKHTTGGYGAGLYVVAGTLAVSAAVTLILGRKASGSGGEGKPLAGAHR
jgi:MFS transporter, ACS family, tartrate transporter